MIPKHRAAPRAILRVEPLERRECPSAVSLDMSPWPTWTFDNPKFATLTSQGFVTYTNDANTQASISSAQAYGGTGSSLAIASASGSLATAVTRAWAVPVIPQDIQYSAAIYLNSQVPAQLIARGTNLDDPAHPSFYALCIANNAAGGPTIQLIRVNAGNSTTLGTLTLSTGLSARWLVVTFSLSAGHLQGQFFDSTTNQYLNSSGAWVSSQAYALDLVDVSPLLGTGAVGVGRPISTTGALYFDNLSVVPLPSQSSTTVVENFDGVGSGLPGNWSSYTSDINTTDGIAANSTAPSQPNSFNISSGARGLSNAITRAWLNSILTDGQEQTSVKLSTVKAQLIARGSNLNTSTPSYYALSAYRSGYLRFELDKVVNGTETALAILPGPYVSSGTWLQMTLVLNGTHLQGQLYNPNTHLYLNSSGTFQAAQTYAIDLMDGSITAMGFGGLGRDVSTVGTQSFDDFSYPQLSGTAGFLDSFEVDAPGALPTNTWSQTSLSNFAVGSPGSDKALTPAQVLAVPTGPTRSVAQRAWNTTVSFANEEVTAAVDWTYALNNSDFRIFGQGSGLTGSSPTYYALDLSVGATQTLALLKDIGGTVTTLASIPVPYFHNWVQATLYINGANLRAQLFDPGTGQYFVGVVSGSSGWQSTPAWALNLTDNSINAAGLAGIDFNNGAVTGQTAYFDNFAVTALTNIDSTPPTASITSPTGTLSSPAQVSGTITINVNVADSDGTVARVEYYVDNVLHATKTSNDPSFNWTVDTASWTWDQGATNSIHQLYIKAYDSAGNWVQSSVQFLQATNNTAVTPIVPVQNMAQGRVAELAYGFDPSDPTLVQNNVDLVIAGGPTALADIYNDRTTNGQQPITQLIYSNIQTTYGSLLANWLNYADANSSLGYTREGGFYHVAVPWYYIGSSPSSEPVEYFVQAYLGTATTSDSTQMPNQTSTLQGSSLTYGSATPALYFAYPDKFREVNVTLATPPSGSSFNYELEYPTAVDALGNPTSWAKLTTLSDGTSNGTSSLATSGRITFDPPSDWVTAEFPASPASSYMSAPARLYYLRFNALTPATTPPVISSILGRDYTGAGAGTSGVIPVFDSNADIDHDGYLSDAEYYNPNRNPADTARFAYESRLVGSYGEMRFPMNVTDPGFMAWAIQYHQNLLANPVTNPNHAATGIMMDNSNGQPPAPPGVLVETEGSYDTDYAALLNKIDQAIAPNWILPNTGVLVGAFGPQLQDATEVIQATQAGYQEKLLRASTEAGVSLRGVFDNTAFASFVNFVVNIVPALNAGSSSGPFDVIDSLAPQDGHQNRNTEAEKSYWQLATLAAYDIVSDPTRTFLDFDGGGDPGSPWVQSSPPPVYNHFSGAAAVNLGQPNGPAKSTLFKQTHADNGQTYDSYVYERDYTLGTATAIALFQPISQSESSGHADGVAGGDTNAYLLPPGTYYYLNYDGSVGASISGTVLISNAQGIILISGPGSMTPNMTPAIQGGAGQAMLIPLPAQATGSAASKLLLAVTPLSNADASFVLFVENAQPTAAIVYSIGPDLPKESDLHYLQVVHKTWDDATLQFWTRAGETGKVSFGSTPRLRNPVQALALEDRDFDDLVDCLVLSRVAASADGPSSQLPSPTR
jgi:hypothetical protein